MNRSNRKANRSFRNKALVGAIVAALALGTAGVAGAQSTAGYQLDTGAWTQYLQLNNYLHNVNNTQSLSGTVLAPLTGADSIFDTFTGTTAPQTNSSNSITAFAAGNSAVGNPASPTLNDKAGNTIDMGLLGADGFGNSGLGILSGQLNSNNGVTASSTDATIATTLTNYTDGTVTQNSNTLRADTVGNDASSHIDGNLPATAFAGTTNGNVTVNYPATPPADTAALAGDIVVGNNQVNAITTSGASVTGGGITIADTGSDGTTATYSNSDNIVAASFVGNRSDNAVTATGADGAPSYNGSVVVSNGQANVAAGTTTSVGNSGITTTLDGGLAGAITQSGDTISSSTQGNTSSNAISFASGINIDGNAGATTLSLAFGTGTIDNSQAAGDLVLLNVQGNDNGSAFASTITGTSDISVTAGSVATGASVTLHDDHISASAGGNAADNGISASGASFSGNVAAGNQQVNNAGGNVSATVTGLNLQSNMNDGGTNSAGDVSVDASSIGATAQGNQATTDVNVAGTSFASGTGTVSASASMPTANNIAVDTGGAGISVGNAQANYSSTVTATNTGSTLGATYADGLTGGSSTVSSNAVGSSAGGNQATTSAELGGDNGQFSAALANNQYDGADVTSSTTGGQVAIAIGAGSAGATLTVGSNSLSSSAHGNQGTNTLSSDFTNATLGAGAGGWTGASTSLDPTAGIAGTNAANGAMALVSTQVSDTGAVSSDVTNGSVGVAVATATSNTPVTVNANSVSSTAVANQVNNTVDPGVGNLTALTDTAAQVASLSNFQYANANDVTSDITTAALAQVGATFGTTLDTSAVTVSSNDISTFAGGNVAGNGMAISGTNYAPGTVAPGGINGLSTISPTSVSAYAAYTLQNAQGGSGGSREASVTNGTVGGAAAGNVTDSPITVDANQITSDARDNYASNALSFSGFSTLSTTGALQSVQGTDPGGTTTSVSSTIGGTFVAAGSLAGAVTGSDITVSGNDITAKAIANTALNGFGISAGQLGGDSIAVVAGARGAVLDAAGYQASADYSLSNLQDRNGTVTASVTTGGTGGGSGTNFDGGSLTVAGNSTMALAQSNSASNGLSLNATSTDASAALLNSQIVETASNVTATSTSDDGFAAYVGGALGTTTALPVTVSGNSMVAQAGLNTATNTLGVTGTSAIDTTGVTVAGASNDVTFTGGYTGAAADFSVYNNQQSSSGASATASGGLVGIEAAGGGIGNGTGSGLTVGDNHVASQATANDATNALSLSGASSIGATSALANQQTTNAATISATTNATAAGIYDDTGADINGANLDVSGNGLSAAASGNSASNSMSVQPVALNAGLNQATVGQVLNTGSTAAATTSLLNSQSNAATISATVDGSSIGVNAGLPGAPSPLLASTATVAGNSAMASGSGNSASNSIMLASLASGTASSALVSDQVNTANVTATVSNTHIGVNAGDASDSPVTVSGNTISATAVGNSATNHITISH